jgi:RNA polymerase sigma-70 factor (ECF subfamily)
MRLRAHLDALDVVQSVHRILLVSLREHKLTLDSPERLLGLALTLIRRRVARHWRQLKHQAGVGNTGTSTRAEDVAAGGDEEDPARRLQFTEGVDHLLGVLDGSDRHLVALRLRGYSTADVARHLGVDARVLCVRLGRLRQRVREEGLLADWV